MSRTQEERSNPVETIDLRVARVTRPARVADVASDVLRSKILSGELRDGDLLPKQETLMAQLGTSRDALRQALQILESEGLVRIRRGRVGGVEVQRPSTRTTAYMMALTLEAEKARLSDVGQTLQILEPACARACALRTDRVEAVLPTLEAVQKRARAAVGEVFDYSRIARHFHMETARLSGNPSLASTTCALEEVFATHEAQFIDRTRNELYWPGEEHRRQTLDTHDAIIDSIREGNGEAAHDISARHLVEGQSHAISHVGREPIMVSTLRRWRGGAEA